MPITRSDSGELQRLSHFVQLADPAHVRERRLEPALGMPLHVTCGVEPSEGLADRSTGHAEQRRQSLLTEPMTERELAEQEPALQYPVRRLGA